MAESIVAPLLVFWLLTVAVLPFWTFADAQERSPHEPLLWAFVVFVGGIWGFLLYLLVGRTGERPDPTEAHY